MRMVRASGVQKQIDQTSTRLAFVLVVLITFNALYTSVYTYEVGTLKIFRSDSGTVRLGLKPAMERPVLHGTLLPARTFPLSN